MNQNTNNELDATLKKMLEAYGEAAPRRKPEAEKRTRDRFMAELDDLTQGATAPNPIHSGPELILMVWAADLKQLKENLAMSFAQRSTMRIITLILVLAIFLFGGGGITAFAAGAALPGDALYPVKTGIENARAGFTGNPETQARLFLGFAGKRLDEIRALISEGRLDKVNETAGQFEKDIQKALDAIQKLSEKDPARAAELSSQAVHTLKGYSDSLNEMLTGAPKDVQPIIENALNASQSAAGNGNANSNFNSNDDNSNLNGNFNSNDDNGNLNSNSNSNDDNDNLNSNSNSNDDNSNLNSNTNGNDDNSNLNSNTNSNDDNNNLNSNSNSNSNDNSGGNGSNSNGNGGGGGGGSGGGGGNGGSGDGGGGSGNDDNGGGGGGGGGGGSGGGGG